MFKVILTTISATLVIIFFVASFFLNSILGLFNLATIPLSLLPEFHQSKQIIQNLKTNKTKLKSNNKALITSNKKLTTNQAKLKTNNKVLTINNTKLKNSYTALNISNLAHKNKIDTIKKRHKIKDLNSSKRFAERSGKKITSSAIAAGTIGTAGVIFTVAGLEVYDYCEDKQELLKDENILFDTSKKFDYETCLDEATKDSEKIITLIKESSSEAIKSSWNGTKDFSQEQWKIVKKESDDIWQKTNNFNKKQWRNIEISAGYIWRQTSYSVKKYWQSFKDEYDF